MTAKSFPPVNTQEIYDYRPGSTKVHRISEYETGEQLIPGTTPITGRHVLLRDPPKAYADPEAAALIQELRGGGRQHRHLRSALQGHRHLKLGEELVPGRSITAFLQLRWPSAPEK